MRVGKEPASETELPFWSAVLERLGARCGSTGLSSADALDPRCDLGKEIEVIVEAPLFRQQQPFQQRNLSEKLRSARFSLLSECR